MNSLYPEDIDNDQLESLLTTIRNQGEEIEMQEKEISRLQAKLEKVEGKNAEEEAEKPAPAKKAAPKKAPAKKAEEKPAAKKAPAKKAPAKKAEKK